MKQEECCELCGEINPELQKVTYKTIKKNVCQLCFNSIQEEKQDREELIKYICKCQNINIIHPHSARQVKELIYEGYSYKQLLFYARFYYEFEKNICLPKYNHTIAWLKSRAIPNADAYMEMNDLTIDDFVFGGK